MVDFKGSQADELNQLLAVEQDTLQVPDTEVEEWVIRGMGKRVIEGRIDQMARCVAITRAAAPAFTDAHWQKLAEQLAAWKVSHFRSAPALCDNSMSDT